MSLASTTAKYGGESPFTALRKAICDTQVQSDIRVIRSRGLDHAMELLRAIHPQVIRRSLVVSNRLNYIPRDTFVHRATKRPHNKVGQMLGHMLLGLFR